MLSTLAKPLMSVALVAVLAAPQPLRACCLAGGEHESCCRAAKQAAEPAANSCCHKSNPDGRCGRDNTACHCCRSADPRIASAVRTLDDVQPLVGILSHTAISQVANAELSASNLPAPPGGQSAIPHRILHCSWLI